MNWRTGVMGALHAYTLDLIFGKQFENFIDRFASSADFNPDSKPLDLWVPIL